MKRYPKWKWTKTPGPGIFGTSPQDSILTIQNSSNANDYETIYVRSVLTTEFKTFMSRVMPIFRCFGDFDPKAQKKAYDDIQSMYGKSFNIPSITMVRRLCEDKFELAVEILTVNGINFTRMRMENIDI